MGNEKPLTHSQKMFGIAFGVTALIFAFHVVMAVVLLLIGTETVTTDFVARVLFVNGGMAVIGIMLWVASFVAHSQEGE